MRFVAITWLVWLVASVDGAPTDGEGIVKGVVEAPKGPVRSAPKLQQTTVSKSSTASSLSKTKSSPKKLLRQGEANMKDKRLEKERDYLDAEWRTENEEPASTETLMTNIYAKGRERRRMKNVLAAYLLAHLALTAARSYTITSPPLNVIFTSVHALMEKLLPNIEERWVDRQTELQGLVWDYLDRYEIKNPPAKVKIYHGSESVTVPVLKKSRDAIMPEDFRDIGKSSYTMYKNIVF